MKKYDEPEGVWRTVGGRRIFIKNGQSLSEAMIESGKFRSHINSDDMDSNTVDIEIDGLTDCLEVRSTGETVETEFGIFKMTSAVQRKLKREKWRFDWTKAEGENLYALRVKGDDTIQGLISFSHEQGYTTVFLAESNPSNVGRNGKYIGTGAHLFAIACYESKKHGNDGFVTLTAKTKLVDHYAKTLGAYSIGPKENMVIDESTAQKLIDKYIKK